MGGKQKQAQRTKGNARPSSSGRSAEKLLASTTGAAQLSGFAGFGSIQLQSDHHLALLKASGGEAAAAAVAAAVDPLMDGDCRMLMKRMTKKDAVTRLKALQEFQSFCWTRSEESLLAALPVWPRLFNKLCLDVDRRVRETTHEANNRLVLRVKRNLAPHVRSLMANWLMGMCDAYAPAACAAKAAFDSAFSPEKQADAIVYCQENVFSTIEDNLFRQTPQSLSDYETTAADVMEDTYNRVLSSSLLSMSCVLGRVSADQLEKLDKNYEKILNEGKFWKLAKSQVTQVRGTWLTAIVAICGKIPAVLDPHLSKLCPAVLGNLDESEPLTVSAVWDAALHVLTAFQTCWTHVNIQKAVLPKLLKTLRLGCAGNAKVVGPYLLPLLSKIPADVSRPTGKFVADFFSNLRSGIALEKVRSSSSECGALVRAYVECLRFLVIDGAPELTKDVKAAEDLIATNLLPLIESSLTEESSRLSTSPLYPLLEELVGQLRFLGSSSSSSDVNSAAYHRAVESYFWDAFSRICVACCEAGHAGFALVSLQSLFTALSGRQVSHQATKRRSDSRKVRFSDAPKPDTGTADPISGDPPPDDESTTKSGTADAERLKSDAERLKSGDEGLKSEAKGLKSEAKGLKSDAERLKSGDEALKSDAERLKSDDSLAALKSEDSSASPKSDTNAAPHLQDCVLKLCSIALKKYDADKSVAHLRFLTEMNAVFASKRLCGALVEAAIGSPPVDSGIDASDKASFLFHEQTALDRLSKARGAEEISLLVRLSFDFWRLAKDCGRKMTALNRFCRVNSDVLASAVRHLLAGDLRDDPTVTSWFHGADFSRAVLETAEVALGRNSGGADLAAWELLDSCLAGRDGPVLTSDYTSRLLSLIRGGPPFTRNTPSGDDLTSARVCGLVARFFAAGSSCWLFEESHGLLFDVLTLVLKTSMDLPRICEMETCWKAGIASLMAAGGELTCLVEACRFAHKYMFDAEDPMTVSTTSLSFVRGVLDAVRGSGDSRRAQDATVELLKAFLPTAEKYAGMYSELCRGGLAAHAVSGQLHFDELPSEVSSNVRCDDKRTLAFSALAAELLTGLVVERQRCVDQRAVLGHFLVPHLMGILNTVSYCSLPDAKRRKDVAGRAWSEWGDELWSKLAAMLKFLKAVKFDRILLDECSKRAGHLGFLYAYSLNRLARVLGADANVEKMLTELHEGSRVQVLQIVLPTLDAARQLNVLKSLLRNPAYGDPKWLAVVTACLAGTREESPEKSDKSVKYDKLESSSKPGTPEPFSSKAASEVETDQSPIAEAGISEEDEGAGHPVSTTGTNPAVLQEPLEKIRDQSPNKEADVPEESEESGRGKSTTELTRAVIQDDGLPDLDYAEIQSYCGLSERPDFPAEDPGCSQSSRSEDARTEVLEEDSKTSELVKELLNGLRRYKMDNEAAFMMDPLILEHDWSSVSYNVQAVNLLTAVVDGHWAVLEVGHWDFILCGLGAWLKMCHESRFRFGGLLRLRVLAAAVFRLAAAAATTVNRRVVNREGEAAANLVTEWNEFFAARFFVDLLDVFSHVAAAVASAPAEQESDQLMETLVAAIEWIPADAVVGNCLPPRLDARWDENDSYLPASVNTALNTFSPMLSDPRPEVQWGACAILRSLVAVLPGYSAGEPDRDEASFPDLVPGALMAALTNGAGDAALLLAGVDFGDSYVATTASALARLRGYLYAAGLVLRLFAGLSPEARSGQAARLRDSGAVAALLNNLFRMMPENPARESATASALQLGAADDDPSSFAADRRPMDLPGLACATYAEVLRRLPALAREWFNGLERRAAAVADKWTARHVSPALLAGDIGAVHRRIGAGTTAAARDKTTDNMIVRTRPSTREVVATYDVEEIKFELVVRLAENHPLGPVAIETGRRVGVSSQQWRVWLLQLTTFLMHQNGSILDGLSVWKRNIDKKFEGVEECYVCYYVLHSASCQLPRKTCRTCKKKFHSSCLYKWFITSGHSTCPLCRSIW